MEEIPDLPLEKILQMTDIASRKSARSVCTRWKSEVETNKSIGLAVIIDDRSDGLLEFIERVSIREVNMKHLSCSNPAWFDLRFDETKTLIFTGYVNPDFVTRNLLNQDYWNNLSKLFFYGTALISQKFNEAKPTADLHSGPKRLFPNLIELHVVVAIDTQSQAKQQLAHGHRNGQFSVPPDVPEAGAQHYISLTLKRRVQRNAVALMAIIQCPKLRVLLVTLGTKSSYPLETIIDFVERHSETLQKIILPSIARTWILPPMAADDRVFRWPTKLKSICLAQVLDLDPANNRIGADLLFAQTALEEVLLSYSKFCINTFVSVVKRLLSNNLATLKYVTIRSEWVPEGVDRMELDLKLLSSSTGLEVLRLIHRAPGKKTVHYPIDLQPPCWHQRIKCPCKLIQEDTGDPVTTFHLKNINCLPKSLKVFETSFTVTEDFDGTRFILEMINLEELRLRAVPRQGFMETRESISTYFQAAFRHRKLNEFETEFLLSNNVVPDIGGSWSSIRRVVMETPKLTLSVMNALRRVCKEDVKSFFLFESIYMGGMVPEYAYSRSHCNGYRKKRGDDTVYYRNYFDIIDDMIYPSEMEMMQPFDINHNSVGSYGIEGKDYFTYERYWGGIYFQLPDPVLSMSIDYHTVYNDCHFDQLTDAGVILLAEPEFRAIDKILRNVLLGTEEPLNLEMGVGDNSDSEFEDDETTELKRALMSDEIFMEEINQIVENLGYAKNPGLEKVQVSNAKQNVSDENHNGDSQIEQSGTLNKATNTSTPQIPSTKVISNNESEPEHIAQIHLDASIPISNVLETAEDRNSSTIEDIPPAPEVVFTETTSFILHRYSKPEFV